MRVQLRGFALTVAIGTAVVPGLAIGAPSASADSTDPGAAWAQTVAANMDTSSAISNVLNNVRSVLSSSQAESLLPETPGIRVEPVVPNHTSYAVTPSQAASYIDQYIKLLKDPAYVPAPSSSTAAESYVISQINAVTASSAYQQGTALLISDMQLPGAVTYFQEELTALIDSGVMTPDDLNLSTGGFVATSRLQYVLASTNPFSVLEGFIETAAGYAGYVVCAAAIEECGPAEIIGSAAAILVGETQVASTVYGDVSGESAATTDCNVYVQYPYNAGGGEIDYNDNAQCSHAIDELQVEVSQIVDGSERASTGEICFSCSAIPASLQTYSNYGPACDQTGGYYDATVGNETYTSQEEYSSSYCY